MALSSRNFLLKNHPKDWWTQSLEANVEARKAAHKQYQSLPASDHTCATCKSIDFGYLLLGDADTGHRKSVQEGLDVGPLDEVQARANGGCQICAGIILPLAQEAVNTGDPRVIDNTTGQPMPAESLSVHLTVSDIEFSRHAPALHRSGGIRVSVRRFDSSSAVSRSLSIVDEWNKPFADTGPVSGNYICIIDHELSVYRLLPERVDLDLCQSWLQRCLDTHQDCQRSPRSPEVEGIGRSSHDPGFKLIDVQLRSVVSLSDDADFEYATLSYVCGPAYSVCVLEGSDKWTTNAAGVKQHPLDGTLPRTLEDAMKVAAGIGLRFLWVDSICIPQDDRDEQAKQINKMHSIYGDAAINIVAASGIDSHAGLPGVGSARTQSEGNRAPVNNGLAIGMSRPSMSDLLSQYRWMGRAWTYQELILSRRCLIFTETEAFFYCGSSTYRESQIEDANGPGPVAWAGGASNAYRIGNSIIMQTTHAEGQMNKVCEMFSAAVEEYTKRALSYQTDGLNAFTGLAMLLSKLLGSGMTCGCPSRMMVNCLTFRPQSVIATEIDWPKRRMMQDKNDEKKKNDDHLRPLFPSWSWVAWKAPLRIPLFSYFYWGSEMQILSYLGFPHIPSSAYLRYHFTTWQPPATSPVSYPDDTFNEFFPNGKRVNSFRFAPTENAKLGYLDGVLPVATKISLFQIAPMKDTPGHVEISTLSGGYAGSCDVRGLIETADLQPSEATFIQIWLVQRKGKGSSCNVMLVRLYNLPPAQNTEGQDDLLQAIAKQAPFAQAQTAATAQAMNRDPKFLKGMSDDCPPSLTIRHQLGKTYEPSNILLGTRLGVGYIDFDSWIESKPQDALVFLG